MSVIKGHEMEEADHKTPPSVKGRSVSSSVLQIDSIKTQVPILQENGKKNARPTFIRVLTKSITLSHGLWEILV